MTSFLNINGRLLPVADAGVPHDNRAFRYGYGLFETMLYQNGQIELAEYHWERLFAGMLQLSFEVHKHFNAQMLQEEVQRTVRKNGLEALCRVRLQVWPGSGGVFDAASFAPQFLIECFPLQEELIKLNENGLTMGIATGICKSKDSLANLKSCNSLIYAIAARQAKQHKWNDAFIYNTDNRIIESTIANVFWIKGDTIYTPPLEEGCINGVMRRHLLHTLEKKNIPILEKPLTLEEIGNADELFITNAIRKIKWVINLLDFSYVCNRCNQLSEWL